MRLIQLIVSLNRINTLNGSPFLHKNIWLLDLGGFYTIIVHGLDFIL